MLALTLAGAPVFAAPPDGAGSPSTGSPASGSPSTVIVERGAALAALRRVDRLAEGFYLAHPDADAMKARARGEAVAARVAPPGLTLRGLRPDGWAGQLALRDGDILQRLDGTPVDGAAALLAVALRLHARLMGGAGWHFEAELLRDGRPLTLRYVIQDEQPPATDPGARPWKPAPPSSSTP